MSVPCALRVSKSLALTAEAVLCHSQMQLHHLACKLGVASTYTKQATLIELLKRPEGVSLAEMVQATGWQQHTVRGAMAGALKRKLGLNIVSDKTDGQERKYRITTETI